MSNHANLVDAQSWASGATNGVWDRQARQPAARRIPDEFYPAPPAAVRAVL